MTDYDVVERENKKLLKEIERLKFEISVLKEHIEVLEGYWEVTPKETNEKTDSI